MLRHQFCACHRLRQVPRFCSSTRSAASAKRRSGQPPRVIALADKAQQRLCRRFRRLAEHKPGPVVTVAVARKLVGFLWAALHPKAA